MEWCLGHISLMTISGGTGRILAPIIVGGMGQMMRWVSKQRSVPKKWFSRERGGSDRQGWRGLRSAINQSSC